MSTPKIRDPRIWDCGSSLYDSFELKSFKDQLDLAIARSRCNSMPRRSEPAAACTYPSVPAKKSYIRMFVASIFRFRKFDISCRKSFVVEYEKVNGGLLTSDSLVTIPEGREIGFKTPDLDRKVRKTVSARYATSSSSRILNLK